MMAKKPQATVPSTKSVDELLAESKRLRTLSDELMKRAEALTNKIEDIAERQRRAGMRNPKK